MISEKSCYLCTAFPNEGTYTNIGKDAGVVDRAALETR